MRSLPNDFAIGSRRVGGDHPVYVIAEAGVAHFGDEAKALRLVDLAVKAGADAVKFQVFDVDALISRALPDWRARLGARQLPYSAFARIQAHCAGAGVTFFATAHDAPSLEFLHSLDVPVYKIGSGEVGNWPFLRAVASKGKPVILSTGMYEMRQVAEAFSTIAETGNHEVAVLHCVTRYPTPPAEAALGRIADLRREFGAVTGYSDHTAGFHFPLAAVALGAKIVEKHISLDFDVPDAQDWKVSCGPHNFADFVSQLRELEAGLSRRLGGPTADERLNMAWATKSLVSAHDIPAGAVLAAGDLTAKRPGTGIPPSRMSELIGRIAAVGLPRDTVIRWEDVR
jgi:N,N'-diacetyllegionaminate synthase